VQVHIWLLEIPIDSLARDRNRSKCSLTLQTVSSQQETCHDSLLSEVDRRNFLACRTCGNKRRTISCMTSTSSSVLTAVYILPDSTLFCEGIAHSCLIASIALPCEIYEYAIVRKFAWLCMFGIEPL
jgi:hypothetical protein